MQTIRRQLPVLAAAAVIILLTAYSAAAKAAASAALAVCGAALVPSLLPFYIAANLLLNIGLPSGGKVISTVMRKIFRLPATAAGVLVLGLVGGYPVGAAAAASLYRQGSISKDEAMHLSAFCNNAGPAFIIGAAGLSVFGSASVGLRLYAIHAVSALMTGLIFRAKSEPTQAGRPTDTAHCGLGKALPQAVGTAAKSMLMICGYMVFFSAVLAGIRELPPIRQFSVLLSARFPVGGALLSGVCELSCGIMRLSGCPKTLSLITASVLLGFGGICVMLQSASVFAAVDLPITKMLLGKLTQALIAGLLTCVTCFIPACLLLVFSTVLLVFPFFLMILKNGTRKKQHNLLS